MENTEIISSQAINNRNFWISEIQKLSGNFGKDSDNLEWELEKEVKKTGNDPKCLHFHLLSFIFIIGLFRNRKYQ
jgi:type II restriction enzyme